MTEQAKEETIELVNVLRLITNAINEELKQIKYYLTDEERVRIFLILEDEPVNELWLAYRLSDYKQIIEVILANRAARMKAEELDEE